VEEVLLVVEEAAGRDQDAHDRAVLAEQARLVVAERLASEETLENVAYHGRIGVKLRDAVSHVFGRSVPEGLIVGLVGPDDGSRSIDPVEPHDRVVQVVEHELRGAYVRRGTLAAR
jgi:hypothetical protein